MPHFTYSVTLHVQCNPRTFPARESSHRWLCCMGSCACPASCSFCPGPLHLSTGSLHFLLQLTDFYSTFPYAFQERWAWNLFHVLPSWWDYCSLRPLTGWFVPPCFVFHDSALWKCLCFSVERGNEYIAFKVKSQRCGPCTS